MIENSIPQFSDLVKIKALDGEKIKIEDILEKPIIVTGFRVAKSKYSHKGIEQCTTIQFYQQDDLEKKR